MSGEVSTGGGGQATSPFLLEFEAGEMIFSEGDLGTEMYIIQNGRVEIVKQIRGEEMRLALLEKGDFFGEMSILEGLARTASVRAIDKTRVVEVNGSTFGQMLQENPEIAIRMLRKLSHRLRRADDLLREMGGLEVMEASREDYSGLAERPVATQYLLSESGHRFFLLADCETMVGRRDPVTGIDPGIDLTSVDPDRSTSRRHATIHRRAGKYFLTEEIGTTNGTFVGDRRLQTRSPVTIGDGDRIRLGLVELTFHTQ